MNTIKNTSIIVPRAQRNGWYAELSNGRSMWQDEPGGGLQSAWWRMKELCDDQNVQVTKLKLVLGDAELHIEDCNAALGFWQAQRMWVGQHDYAYTGDPDWHWRGLGFVFYSEPMQGHVVSATWVAYPSAPYQEPYGIETILHPQTGKPIAKKYQEYRIAMTERQIIWKPGVVPQVPLG